MAEDETTFNVQGLDQILKALKAKPPVARIGILGDSTRNNARSSMSYASVSNSQATSNATVGAAHEFGTSKMPMRSFLRIPLMDFLDKELESSGLIDKSALKDVIKQGSLMPWMIKVSKVAEKIVQGAFDSNGYGKWAPWKGNYESATGNILVNTQQLRNSITSEVK